ncbi:hypothetical protein DPMN_002137 [Dreissena polymorpha]|uniref:Uncharacterized protein n=1 Tax=Dreissena polymorpha TaxID=45954 RepID=A0A9D4RTJ5_DREPO|nr:hypothetical protein DPMN_002137 [Dreissena polymorpha]
MIDTDKVKCDPSMPVNVLFAHLRGFHDDWAKNVTSRKNTPPTGGHVFFTDLDHLQTLPRYQLNQLFTKKTAPPPGSHVIQLTGTIFELNSQIKEKLNDLTKLHENWAKNVTCRVFTCFHYIHIEKNSPPTGGHVFSPIWTICKLFRDIN